jgi:uncharacterized protein (DUF58 family)
VKIPRTPIRTTSKANWLIEFSVAFVVLGILTREFIFVALGVGITLTIAYLGLAFQQKLTLLRTSLKVLQQLSRTRVSLGDSIEGKLTIRNPSKSTAHLKAVEPLARGSMSFAFYSSFDRVVLPGTEATSDFAVTPLERGHSGMTGYRLKLTDRRDLFAGELTLDSVGAGSVEVYPGLGIVGRLTPHALYGGRPETLRKSASGGDYAGIRQYDQSDGDAHYRIEWKATARLRTLMVKEFHPETETTVQILIDAAKTMRRQSYVGTRLDEALTVAQLLTESVARSRTMVGIWVFSETKLVRVLKPARATEQAQRLRELSLSLQTAKGTSASPTPLQTPRQPPLLRAIMPNGERIVGFLRLLRIGLSLVHRRTGAYKAFTEASRGGRGLLVVLTDLETSAEALLEAISSKQARSKAMVAQIGAAWRLSDNLEQAYSEWQRNDRILKRLERSGLPAFDLRPEALAEAVATQIGKSVPAVPAHR